MLEKSVLACVLTWPVGPSLHMEHPNIVTSSFVQQAPIHFACALHVHIHD
jgi:hypothetical protein